MTTATGAKYYKDSNRLRHKATYDPQVRWSRNNIAVTMERFQPIASPSSPSESSSCTSHQDYSYAYYEPGAIMCHSNIPTPDEVAGPSAMPPPNSMRALLMKSKERQKTLPANRHTYQTRYGTHENIYEDVSDEVKHNRLASSAHSLNNSERGPKNDFQTILHHHYRILESLDLSVEELLMSSSPPQSVEPEMQKRVPTVQSCVVDTLGTQLTSLDLKDEHLNMKSPVSEFVINEDSGFSGSSSGASYIGSLREYKTAITRSLRRSSAPSCAPGSSAATTSTDGTIYGSCRTAKYPSKTTTLVHHPVDHTMHPTYNGTTTVKLKHEKSPDASQKSMKFALWNRRS